ncbi:MULTISPECIES: tyrosine-type recombinase/integrase [Halobacillus]|uniref:Tyrosine-type recombinase/integrase n=1 Tax=Halobacillus amylolyticus TaxID=2932259 RepID=A0ABY4HHS8_9BACI|nr:MULTISPECIES: tyrosine-type recombinase/integrase [Halobacillus]UOR14179.1 tyrosine-type recombinase/integrase [Halobacillus amylolyticus]
MTKSVLEVFREEGLKGKSESTCDTYIHALEQFNHWLEGTGTNLEDFSRSDVQQYIDYLTAKRKSAATVNKIWNAIKPFARWTGNAKAVQDIRVVKMADLKKQAPKGLDRIERNRLVREVDRDGNKRDYAIILMLLYTGVRVRELVSLNRDDIQKSERKGEVRVIGKGNRERIIPLNVEVRRALTDYLDQRGDNQPALFLSSRVKRISIRSVQTVLGKYKVHPHALRHTFITGLVRAGEDISVIQSLSGHQSADMVLRYSQPTAQDKEKAVENIYINSSG